MANFTRDMKELIAKRQKAVKSQSDEDNKDIEEYLTYMWDTYPSVLRLGSKLNGYR